MVSGNIENPIPRKKFYNKSIVRLASIIIITTIVYFFIDFTGPANIHLKPRDFFGMSSLHAKDLVVQEFDNEGNLWATRGMIIYKLTHGNNKFRKVAHIPTGINIYWIRNFRVVRRLTLRPVCVEMVVTDKGDIYALSGGSIWILSAGERRFKKIFQLSNYGFGNRGIMPAGLTKSSDGRIFFGEYFQNQNRREVRIFESNDQVGSFEKAFEFRPVEIRHIHAVQQDPFSKLLWVCTGDSDEESMMAWSNDGFKSIHQLGSGSEIWRICQLVFTEEEIYWGTDTGEDAIAGIYRWSKADSTMHKIQKIHGRIFFGTRLANGTMVMSSNREGSSNELDLKTRLYVIMDENNVISIEGGTWDQDNLFFPAPFAKLRFQRNQGAPSLVITCLNQKEINDGDLFIISEDTILEATKNRQ